MPKGTETQIFTQLTASDNLWGDQGGHFGRFPARAFKGADGRDGIDAVIPFNYINTNDVITVGTGLDFATLQEAVDSLSETIISSDVVVTIEVEDGVLTSSAPVIIPSGEQYTRVVIEGRNTYTTTLVSIQSSSGSVGAYSYVLNVASLTNIAVNDYVLIAYADVASGTYPKAMTGAFKVTATDIPNSRITVDCAFRYATKLPSGAVSGAITIVKTVLNFTGTTGIILNPFAKLKSIDKLIIQGDTTAGLTGIYIYDQAAVVGGATLAICNFAYGVRTVLQGSFDLSGFITGTTVVGLSGVGRFTGCCSTCGGSTTVVTLGGNLNLETAKFTQNSNSIAASGGDITCSGCVTSYNNTWGIRSDAGSRIYAYLSTITDNGGYGVQANYNAFVYITGSTTTNNTSGVSSPAVNTLSADGSYIRS